MFKAFTELLKNGNAWFSFVTNIVLPVGGFVASVVMGGEVNWAAGGFLLVATLVLFGFWLITGFSAPATQRAIDSVVAAGIPTNEARAEIADHLRSLERKYRIASFVAAMLLVAVSASPWLYKAWRARITKIPERLQIATGRPFLPSSHKGKLAKAPFLESVIGYLEEEGKSANKQFEIVFLETQALTHPTPQFELTIYFENQAYDIEGYAFRLQSGNEDGPYEPVPISYKEEGRIVLKVPACEPGDSVFVVSSVSLNQAKAFPSNLAETTRTSVQARTEEKK